MEVMNNITQVLCGRIRDVFVVWLYLSQLISTAFLFDNRHNKDLSENKYELANLNILLPRWTYYSIKTDWTSPTFFISKGNTLKSSVVLDCGKTYVAKIDTLKFLSNSTFLKCAISLQYARKCLINSHTVKIASQTCELILPIPFGATFLRIMDIFPSLYKPYKINCDHLSGAVITNKGLLKINGRPKSNLRCIVHAKTSSNNQLTRLLTISFTSIFQILHRRRRAIPITFKKDSYYAKVKENADIGFTILTLAAEGGSGTYKFTKNFDLKSDQLFMLDETSGELKVRGKLDRENGPTRYVIDVIATDKKDSNLVGRTSVEIEILDVNDNAPVFKSPMYSITIKEERSPGFIIGVIATDQDTGINKKIKYSIIKKALTDVCPFKIDEDTGGISNTEVLNREDKPYYILTIKAEDQGVDPGPLSTTVLVNISLSDVNDNKPVFEKNKYNVTISEQTKVGVTILTVIATDADSGSNGELQYQPIDATEFTIDSNTGAISLAKELDFDAYERFFSFSVVVFDLGSPPNHASTQVEVTIEDFNDNEPRFTRRKFVPSRPIYEDAKVGETVFKLSARDRDSGANGKITFSFAENMSKDFPFALNNATGDIKLIKSLDYESVKEYNFDVIATDGGKPPKSDRASVHFQIENVNDNPPKFKKPSYKLELFEDTPKGKPILTVQAQDPDQLSNENFLYTIDDGNSDRCFAIDGGSGIISLANCKLDYKRKSVYNLKLKVEDEEYKAGYAYLTINVYDANNNAPKFLAGSVTQLRVYENAPIGYSVGEVTAVDADSGENARITYSLQFPNDFFALNSVTGNITTKKLLDRETTVSYTLSIKAQDNGKPLPKYSTIRVIITVLDVNDNVPRFIQSSYEFSFPENVPVGHNFGPVSAVDEDDGQNRLIRYSLKSDGNETFFIDADSGTLETLKPLDREKIASYRLIVVATDQGLKKKLSRAVNVTIKLEDVQDNQPIFVSKEYVFYIDENSMRRLGSVKATLADEEFQESMTYSISKNYLNYFTITRSTGLIQVTRPLDYEQKQSYDLEVRVVVRSGLTDKAKVKIVVNDVNDHPPELEDFYIYLTVIDGKFDPYFNIPATDKDKISKLTYSILSGNELNFVELDKQTGKLQLLKSIVNTASEVKIEFQVADSMFTTTAYGSISVSEVSTEMVQNAIFIVLNNVTRNTLLSAPILRRFKGSLSRVFNCEPGRIFILSIEGFAFNSLDSDDKKVPKVEIGIAAREENSDNFLSASVLKNMLYFNQKLFEELMGYKMITFDFGNDHFCGNEICRNYKTCSVAVNSTIPSSNSDVSPKYVVFRGINMIQKYACKCPQFGFRDGPGSGSCSESYSLCYSNPCRNQGKCVSTDGNYTCLCNAGYSGRNCEIHQQTSTCPGTSPISLRRNPCQHGRCETNSNDEGFTCQCSSNLVTDSEFCTLSSRHFPKDSYISLAGLKQRWSFDISLEFSSYDSNAVLLYNGRYNNNNDFLALQIVNGQVEFSVSLGKPLKGTSKVNVVRSFIPGGVNDGHWHLVKIQYKSKIIRIAVGRSCDLSSADMNPGGKFEYCSASQTMDPSMTSLDLTAPLHIGGLPNIGRKFHVSHTDFVGCIRNITVDFQKVDLTSPMHDFKTVAKCPVKKKFCDTQNPCQAGICVDGLGEARCDCPDGRGGKFCEKDISLASPAVTLVADSQIVIEQVRGATIQTVISFKTRKLNFDFWEEEFNNGMKGVLKIVDGYATYTLDSVTILNLTTFYVSDGNWHEISLKLESGKLLLIGDYNRYSSSTAFTQTIWSSTLKGIGGSVKDSFVGCLKGLSYNNKEISLLSPKNKNVKKNCQTVDVCDGFTACGAHGKCQARFGTSTCSCDPGYQGPNCVDVCLPNPCKHEGVCMKLDEGFGCKCPGNFTGKICETKLSGECEDGYFDGNYGTPNAGTCGPCTCKTNESPICDKYGKREPASVPGKCFCRDTFYSRYGACAECSCLPQTSKSLVCDKNTGQCPCVAGVIGRRCDQCPGEWQEVTSHCIEINTSCPKSYAAGLWWNRVPPGATQVMDCPRGTSGNATRYCHKRRSWAAPNLFGCTSTRFSNIKIENELGSEVYREVYAPSYEMIRIAGIVDKFESKISEGDLRPTDVADLADRLSAVVDTKKLYGKDIEIGYNVLDMLIEYEGNRSGADLISSDDNRFVMNILTSASKLFNLNLKLFWHMIQEKYAGTAGLLQVMEKFLGILSTNLQYVKRGRSRRSLVTLTPYSMAAERMYLEIQPFNLQDNNTEYSLPKQQMDWGNNGDKKLRVWKSKTIQVTLSKRIFHGNLKVIGGEISVGMVIYKTLGKLLPPVYNVQDREKNRAYTIDVHSDVLTLTIPGVKGILPANGEIKIVYKNIRGNFSGNSLTCAFWNYSLTDTISGGWSSTGCKIFVDNSSDVTCYCNHLTSFALIEVRYTEVMPHIYTPSFYTYVGVAICIVLLLITFLVFFCLRQLKSNANSIHKNIALVACLSWAIFITLINRSAFGENYCRLVAIAIQYFITCTFSWLLVEALHMYRMILEPRDINYGQMMFYYFIGWGAPLVVVGVTAGLKPEGYGGKEFCWISVKGYGEMMWVYIAPVLAIIATHLLIVFFALLASCERQTNRKKKAKIVAIRYRFAISMVFLPLLGATVLSALIDVSYQDKLFVYFFPGLCVLEGLYMFLFYVLFNRKVRREVKNAYVRWKTGDKSYGKKPKRRRARPGTDRFTGESNGLIKERFRPMLQAFNIPTSSTTDSSDTDGRRRARIRVAGSETTDFPTTNVESSDSSDDDSIGVRRPAIDSDSDSSENSFGGEPELSSNGKLGHTPQKIEWKQATQKKLVNKRTYASDGPMHSTPSETPSESSGDRQKWKKAMNSSGLSAIPSESDSTANEDGMRYATRPGPRVNIKTDNSTDDSEDRSTKDKTPVSILKKKSQYDGRSKIRAVKVNKKDSAKKPLMSLDDTAEFNDSQV